MMIDLERQAQRCSELIQQNNAIAILTGAGISTNAGIPDFRGPQGLYVTRRYDPQKIFDINYFLYDPQPFYEFARDFIGLEQEIAPTLAHCFLSKLEETGKLRGIVTQNIDALHQKAGSNNVFEIHGSFWESQCLKCSRKFQYPELKEKLFTEKVQVCLCGGVIKPDIVFFGEDVKFLDESMTLAKEADLFLVIGTSCVVYPAGMIPTLTQGQIVVINKEPVRHRFGNVVLSVLEDIDHFFTRLARYLGVNLDEAKH